MLRTITGLIITLLCIGGTGVWSGWNNLLLAANARETEDSKESNLFLPDPVDRRETAQLDRVCKNDLPPVFIPKFKLELGTSRPRDPGGAERSQDPWESRRRLRVPGADTPRRCGA